MQVSSALHRPSATILFSSTCIRNSSLRTARSGLQLGQTGICTPLTQSRPRTAFHTGKTARVFPVTSSLVQGLPKEAGYVALTAVSSAILTLWQMVQVSIQRQRVKLPYPKMYEDMEGSVFNCYQRAHQNTLESYPAFIVLLLVAGVGYPITASACGMVWVLGRIFYTLGYYTGDPKNRHKGAWSTFGLLGLLVTASVFAVKQII